MRHFVKCEFNWWFLDKEKPRKAKTNVKDNLIPPREFISKLPLQRAGWNFSLGRFTSSTMYFKKQCEVYGMFGENNCYCNWRCSYRLEPREHRSKPDKPENRNSLKTQPETEPKTILVGFVGFSRFWSGFSLNQDQPVPNWPGKSGKP